MVLLTQDNRQETEYMFLRVKVSSPLFSFYHRSTYLPWVLEGSVFYVGPKPLHSTEGLEWVTTSQLG